MAPPRTRFDRTFTCEQCGTRFVRRVSAQWKPGESQGRFCSRRCLMECERDKRRRFPKDESELRALLHDLYVVQRKTTPEIGALYGTNHRVVIGALQRAGIQRRGLGPRGGEHCCEDDCRLPIHKVKHKTNGSWYGRRCRLHWIIYRMRVNQEYNDKHLGKDDEAWLRRLRQLLARVRRLNREVSQSLKPESAPATTSPDACPR